MTEPVVLFDIDGTLTDTNYLHTLAWRRAFLDHGHDVASAQIHKLIGAGASVLMESCIDRSDDRVKEAWRTHFDALVPEIRAFPAAADLIEAVRQRGGKAVFATSSPGDLVEHHLEALGLTADDVDGMTTDSDVDEAKPAPDVFLAALEKAEGRPTQSLVVGDTGWDIEAARAAQLSTVAVRTGGWAEDELVQAGAIEVHDDVAAILATLDANAVGDLLRR